jgi:hypothetical protein
MISELKTFAGCDVSMMSWMYSLDDGLHVTATDDIGACGRDNDGRKFTMAKAIPAAAREREDRYLLLNKKCLSRVRIEGGVQSSRRHLRSIVLSNASQKSLDGRSLDFNFSS